MDVVTKKEWLEIFPEARNYLEEDFEYQINKYDRLVEEMELQRRMINNFVSPKNKWFHELVMEHFVESDIRKVEKRIKEIDWYLRKETTGNGITDDDIERAKQYPFDQLIEFKNYFALCPFHQEKTASLHWNKTKNIIHCFGCSKSWDTIQFLIEKEGLSFIQAVKVLK